MNEDVTDDETSDEDVPEKKKGKSMNGNKYAVKKKKRAKEVGWLYKGQQERKQTGGEKQKNSAPFASLQCLTYS